MNDQQNNRRTFLADAGMGFTGLALGALLQEDGYTAVPEAPPEGHKQQAAAKASSVIWIFLAGGVSHMESFDIKPALNKYAGKTFDETPFKDFLDKERIEKNLSAALRWATGFRISVSALMTWRSCVHFGPCIPIMACN